MSITVSKRFPFEHKATYQKKVSNDISVERNGEENNLENNTVHAGRDTRDQ